MKKIAGLSVLALIMMFSACGPKAYYETGTGKKKQKYYNDIQYGRNAHPKKNF
jgi:hypothetical protein